MESHNVICDGSTPIVEPAISLESHGTAPTSCAHLSHNAVFKIPSHSFTAFRLRFCTAEEISRSSETVLLGSVPETWVRYRSSLVAKISHRNKFKKRLRRLNSKFGTLNQEFYENYLRFDSNAPSSEDSSSVPGSTGGTDIPASEDNEPLHLFDLESGNSSSEASHSFTPLPSTSFKISISDGESSDDDALASDSTAQNSSTVGKLASQNERASDNAIAMLYNQIYQGQKRKEDTYFHQSPFNAELGPTGFDNGKNLSNMSFYSAETDLNESSEASSKNSIQEPAMAPWGQGNASIALGENDSRASSMAAPQVTQMTRGVTFSDTRTAPSFKRKSVIKIVTPNPIGDNEASEHSIPVQHHHWKMVDKLKSGTVYTKQRAAHELEKIEKRLKVQKFLLNFEVGEILKYEKMLVLVKECDSESFKGPLTEDECCDTRVAERWKEYIVVVRSNSDPDNPVFVQFKNKRNIDKKEEFSLHGIDFKINIYNTIVSFYSTLDKTISISVPGSKEHERSFYILKLHTASSAISWYRFFTGILSTESQNQFSVQIPDLQLHLNIKVPWESFETESEDEVALAVDYKNSGYKIERPKGLKYILDAIDEKLASSKELRREAFGWDLIKDSVLLCLRSFDRLEWRFDANSVNLSDFSDMSSSQVLELRRPVHYPSIAELDVGDELIEPTPIEGFLTRLSSRGGKSRSGILQRQVFKLEYYYSHDNLLMFCAGRDGIPPLPDLSVIDADGHVSDANRARESIKKLPQVYNNNYYGLDACNHFRWLNPDMTLSEFKEYDVAALRELQRRTSQTIQAKGIVDMCHITEIVSVPHEELTNSVKAASSLIWTGSISSPADKSVSDSCFEIRLNSGAKIRLCAPSKLIKDEWINRLSSLVAYWKTRKTLDKDSLIKMKEQNQKKLMVRDTDIVDVSREMNWKSLNAISDPAIYNISDVALTRCVSMSGILYQKPKKHSSFKKFFALLSPGNITLYGMFRRSSSGNIKKTSGYRHYLTIAIHEAYVYSGACTSLDLLDRDGGIDHMHPTDLSQPRVYDDGWMSSERQADRSFTLWFGTKRAIAGEGQEGKFISALEKLHKDGGKKTNAPTSMNPGIVKIVSRLGVTGKSMVFVARSRQERDLWVSRITNSAEKFYIPEDESISLH